MKALPASKMRTIRKNLEADGIHDVIDAQNVREYIRQKRKKGRKDEEEAYNVRDVGTDPHDEVLDKLSLSDEESKALFHMLQDNSIRKDDTSIEEIDWKNVQTF